MSEPEVVLGNVYDKYGTKNPVYRALVQNYVATLGSIAFDRKVERFLDVGCGEGYLAGWLASRLRPASASAIDLSPQMMRQATATFGGVRFLSGSASELPFPSRTFDLVSCLELLEHVPAPEQVIREVRRVCRNAAIFAVPREPIWRALNLARGAYWSALGNTPGHLQHWSRGAFVRMLGGYFRVVEIRAPFPWTMVLCSIV